MTERVDVKMLDSSLIQLERMNEPATLAQVVVVLSALSLSVEANSRAIDAIGRGQPETARGYLNQAAQIVNLAAGVLENDLRKARDGG